jgi:hypothetical protein
MTPEGTSSTWDFRTLNPEQTVSVKIFIIFILAVFVVITVKLARPLRATRQPDAGDGQQKQINQQLLPSTALSLKYWARLIYLVWGLSAALSLSNASLEAMQRHAAGPNVFVVFLWKVSPMLTMALPAALYALLARW